MLCPAHMLGYATPVRSSSSCAQPKALSSFFLAVVGALLGCARLLFHVAPRPAAGHNACMRKPKPQPFEKFRGIGNPGIPSGRKAILRHIRKLRGR